MENKNYIVNTRTRECIITDTESFDGDWKKDYPHIQNDSYMDIMVYTVYEETPEGIPYVMELSVNGGLYTILPDLEKFSKTTVDNEIKWLKNQFDVAQINIMWIRKAPVKHKNNPGVVLFKGRKFCIRVNQYGSFRHLGKRLVRFFSDADYPMDIDVLATRFIQKSVSDDEYITDHDNWPAHSMKYTVELTNDQQDVYIMVEHDGNLIMEGTSKELYENLGKILW